MLAQNLPLILSVATFVTLIVLYGAVVSLVGVRKKRNQLISRTRKWSGGANLPCADEYQTSGQRTEKSRLPFGLSRLSRRSGQIGEGGIYANTPLFYQRAGLYNPGVIRLYQTLRYLLLLAPLCYPLFARVVLQRPVGTQIVLGAVLAGALGYYLPVFWLRVVANYRKKDLNRSFPDALDLLMVCMEAGLGIDSAIRRVSREIHIASAELAKELKILSLELKTGMSRNICLRNLARRTDLPDIDNLVSLLIQAEKYGTGVANALRIHAEEMRQRRYSRLEELAAKLPVKLVIPLMIFIFPALFVVIAGPAAIQVLRVIIQG
ncbi:type II secretion system F family protein [Desulfosediminicola ganghwensis]|uniref:type II secretion system F family protein n=1 Tax=Desulfosediminicola ganghwensis TaxID=2569540 RepID=UPI0010AC446F|nr:type II secretion system F family protein [Desulfosediminicola ganghwensis]